MGSEPDAGDLVWMLGQELEAGLPGQADVRVKLAQEADHPAWPVGQTTDAVHAVKAEQDLWDVSLDSLLHQAMGRNHSAALSGTLRARANSGVLRTMMEQAGSNMLPESFDSRHPPFTWRSGAPEAAVDVDVPDALGDSPVSEQPSHGHFSDQERPVKGEISTAKERARAAQKRFRHRQKERSRNQQKQLDELSTQVQELQQERHDLQQRNKVLSHVGQAHVRQQALLRTDAPAMLAQQRLLLAELAQLIPLFRAGPECSAEEVQQWPLSHFLDTFFPMHIAQLRELLTRVAQGCKLSALELEKTISARREAEQRAALFSCMPLAMFAWNIACTAKSAASPPPTVWSTLLAALKLSPGQQQSILQARSDLLASLNAVATQRRLLLSHLALLLLQSTPQGLPTCPEMQRLRSSLGQEREAVHRFLSTVCDEVFSHHQEALLESVAYPWWPDVWQLASILAEQAGGSKKATPQGPRASAQQARAAPREELPDLSIQIPVLRELGLLPHATAFGFLCQPMLAYGAGLHLKGGIAGDTSLLCAPAAATPLPSPEQLHPMTLLDVYCGAFTPRQPGA